MARSVEARVDHVLRPHLHILPRHVGPLQLPAAAARRTAEAVPVAVEQRIGRAGGVEVADAGAVALMPVVLGVQGPGVQVVVEVARAAGRVGGVEPLVLVEVQRVHRQRRVRPQHLVLAVHADVGVVVGWPRDPAGVDVGDHAEGAHLEGMGDRARAPVMLPAQPPVRRQARDHASAGAAVGRGVQRQRLAEIGGHVVGGALELPLRPLGAVEEEPLAAAAEQEGGRRALRARHRAGLAAADEVEGPGHTIVGGRPFLAPLRPAPSRSDPARSAPRRTRDPDAGTGDARRACRTSAPVPGPTTCGSCSERHRGSGPPAPA